MFLTKRFRFEAAHKLVNYKGICEKLHGHSFVLEVTVQGEMDKEGYVIDFKEIDGHVRERVLATLDHSYLNDIVEICTCERLAKWIWERLEGLNIYEVKLYETDTSWVTYRGD